VPLRIYSLMPVTPLKTTVVFSVCEFCTVYVHVKYVVILLLLTKVIYPVLPEIICTFLSIINTFYSFCLQIASTFICQTSFYKTNVHACMKIQLASISVTVQYEYCSRCQEKKLTRDEFWFCVWKLAMLLMSDVVASLFVLVSGYVY